MNTNLFFFDKKCLIDFYLNFIYPVFDCGSTSGQDSLLLQKASEGLSTVVGDVLWRNEPFLGGAKHSKARDCLRIGSGCGELNVLPGNGTTLGNPAIKINIHI